MERHRKQLASLLEDVNPAFYFQIFIGLNLFGLGGLYFLFPRFLASVLGLQAMTLQGLLEVQSYYGGFQVGLGLFLLFSPTERLTMELILYTFLPLALSRILFSFLANFMTFSLSSPSPDFSCSPEPFDDFWIHILIGILIELPIGLLALVFKKHVPEKEAPFEGETLFFHDLSALALTVAMGYLVFESFCYIFLPFRYASCSIPSALGLIEYQSMFGAVRLGIVYIIMFRAHMMDSLLFIAVILSVVTAAQTAALVYDIAWDGEEVGYFYQFGRLAGLCATSIGYSLLYWYSFNENFKHKQ